MADASALPDTFGVTWLDENPSNKTPSAAARLTGHAMPAFLFVNAPSTSPVKPKESAECGRFSFLEMLGTLDTEEPASTSVSNVARRPVAGMSAAPATAMQCAGAAQPGPATVR